MADSCNRPQWEAELTANITAAGVLDNNFPTAAVGGGAVVDPTAGSHEALLAGTACAAGALKFRTTGTNLLIYIPTTAPTDRS